MRGVVRVIDRLTDRRQVQRTCQCDRAAGPPILQVAQGQALASAGTGDELVDELNGTIEFGLWVRH
ncbi:Uncharacterised protein [Mycobacteroides abscessus subsp. abscessus]|nr:Uncharacterised protein [Mycobacteroides abscessus subsp. abscessus]